MGCFLGLTLWADFLLFGKDLKRDAMVEAGNAMNDYQRICVESAGYHKLRPEDTAQLHASQRSWLGQSSLNLCWPD
jgi:hypothetical protein